MIATIYFPSGGTKANGKGNKLEETKKKNKEIQKNPINFNFLVVIFIVHYLFHHKCQCR